MDKIQAFMKDNPQTAEIIIQINKAIQQHPDLISQLETIQSEQEGLSLLKKYTGINYSIKDIAQINNLTEQFLDLLNLHNNTNELNDELLDNVVGGLSWKGFWKRVGLSFKIAGEAIAIVFAANPKGGDFKGRVNMADDLIKKIEKDAQDFRNAK